MIYCAAIKQGDEVVVGEEGDRHDHVFQMKPKGFFTPGCVHGFVTHLGDFLDRREAGRHAWESGQIDEPTDCLISEDVW